MSTGALAVLTGGMLSVTWTNAPEAFELQGSADLIRWQALSYHLRVGGNREDWGRAEFQFPLTNGLSFYRLRKVD